MDKKWYDNPINKKLDFLNNNYKDIDNVKDLYLKICYFKSAYEFNMINKIENCDLKKIIVILNNKKSILNLSFFEKLSKDKIYHYRARQLYTAESPTKFGTWNDITSLLPKEEHKINIKIE
jgi:hypothetical protein